MRLRLGKAGVLADAWSREWTIVGKYWVPLSMYKESLSLEAPACSGTSMMVTKAYAVQRKSTPQWMRLFGS